MSLKTPEAFFQVLQKIRGSLGENYIDIVLTVLQRGRIVFDVDLSISKTLIELLEVKAFVKFGTILDSELIVSLGPSDLFVSSKPFEGQLIFCKVIVSKPKNLEFDNLTTENILLLKSVFEFNFKDLKATSTPALFLDRDGVIIEHVPYLKDPLQVELKKGIVELIQKFRTAGFRVVMITNQSGLGRGYFQFSDFLSVQNRTLSLLAQRGVWIDSVYFSSHYEKTQQALHLCYPSLRKPQLGMLFNEHFFWNTDFAKSILVGDNITDMQMAHNAKIGHSYLVKNSNIPVSDSKDFLNYKSVDELSEISI